ncbi:hypothetical protein D9615_001120 [Tricholomella constricta]|uniref:Cytochrome P450 n=1 Tax=Tricholomella constricta TaxID=117010 RepID=A0A8H5HKL1_9AGAR|nr:hypothetical protein D9615_001120 [Tricholomella constricta]
MSLPSLLIIIVLVGILVRRWQKSSARLPYPPGPEPSLISGNARDLPAEKPWLTYSRWAKQYGSVFHLREYHQHIIVVNSLKDAMALFEKRSRIYSDRPAVTMVDLMGWDFNAGLIRYGDKWRRHRRLFQENFRKGASVNYRPLQTREIHNLLQKLLLTPDSFMLHYRTVAAAIVMATMYDHDISEINLERFVTVAEQAVSKISDAFLPGAAAVNTFPFLQHLPSWFPGTGFRAFAEGCKVYTDEMQNVPFEFVKERMASGAAISALTATLLERNNARGGSTEAEADIKAITATAFAGGADTTVSALGTFFYAMLVNSDAQRKAQEEIDTVVGTNRLPDYDDRPTLPYIEAIYREVMRWRPVTPLGISHATSEEDIYEGHYIPEGSVVMPNVWAMAHDESIYQQPDLFRPERFIDENGQVNDDDLILTFGFGRRMCPGRHMAEATVWLTIVTVLSTFDITKAKDEDGNEIPVDDDYSDGVVSHKLPFQCSITPRSAAARDLILKANVTYDR